MYNEKNKSTQEKDNEEKEITYCFAGSNVPLCFCGRGAEFDPIAYVQGSFDSVFHGTVTEEFVDSLDDVDSVEDYEAQYEELLASITDSTLASMGITEPGEALKADTTEMFRNIFNASKYEVSSEAVENEDGSYDVEVTVYPLLTYMEVCNDSDGSVTAAAEGRVTSDMSYDEIMMVFMEELIAEINAELANPTYDEPQTQTVHVYIDENGYYNIDEDDMAEITTILMGV